MVETTKEKPAHAGPITRAGIPLAKPPVSKPVLSGLANRNPSVAKSGTVLTAPVGGLAAALNKTHARTLPLPKGLTRFNTSDLKTGTNYFHALLYAETSMWKTSIAAGLGKPEETLIVMTRRKEQLIPLQSMGIEVIMVDNARALEYALTYPERLWEDARADRKPKGLIPLGDLKNLVLDDATEGVNMLLDDAQVIDGKEVKDQRRSYNAAGKDLRRMCQTTLKKPRHLVIVALAKVRDNPITHEEQIGPDIPPSMLAMLNTEVEFAFYIKPQTHQLLTDRDFIVFKDKDDNGKEKIVKRTIFAKSKFDLAVLRKNKGVSPLLKYEEGNLQKLWAKIQSVRA